MTYLIVILIVATLILVHELGHFLAALGVKIPVSRFSLGFGPRLWGVRKKGIDFQLSAVPLGGYVMPKIEDPEAWFEIPLFRRIAFSLGGPLFNLLLPLPIFAVINVATRGFSFEGILVLPFVQTCELFAHIVASIPMLLTQASQLSGPVGVVSQGGKFVGFGPVKALWFSAFLSINFAVFNLLPVPILDGGKIVLSILERIFPRSARAFIPATVLSLFMLLGVFIYATVSDITRIFS